MFVALKTMARTPVRACALVLLGGAAIGALLGCTLRAENDTTGNNNRGEEDMATATFAAGCFWGVEATFRDVKGVTDTEVGYTGGDVPNPTYEEVCTGETGHAEAVRVNYDPEVVTYEELLDVFWGCHNPTTRNRQGPDVGTQYRSVIFYHTPEQEEAARASKKELNESDAYDRPIVTRIRPAETFYRAEEYHQQYLEKQGGISCGL
jgi:peptide-methionine (S)-S-oxide reductase